MTAAEIELLIAALPAAYQEVIKLIDDARAGNVDLTTALARAAALQSTDAANDAKVDADEAKKFPAP